MLDKQLIIKEILNTGVQLPINIGRNNFDKIRVEYFADYSSAFEGFKGGSYTFRTEYMSKLWATEYDFPAIEKKWVIKKLLPSEYGSRAVIHY